MGPRIGLIGDYDASVVAHRAIPKPLELSARAIGVDIRHQWIGTETLVATGPDLSSFAGLWCVPASPYRHTAGVIAAICVARERRVPFLGTCGGFQHAVLECAISQWGLQDAAHAELEPDAVNPVIAPLTCSLVEQKGVVEFSPNSRLAAAYGRLSSEEMYHCRYGLNPEYGPYLDAGPLRMTAWDREGDVRAVELDEHPFFVATLFQPERAALGDEAPPIVTSFLRAVVS